jgi:hypothetical protein
MFVVVSIAHKGNYANRTCEILHIGTKKECSKMLQEKYEIQKQDIVELIFLNFEREVEFIKQDGWTHAYQIVSKNEIF